MDLESARRLESKINVVEEEIRNHQPGETGNEDLSTIERFNLIWDQLDNLAEGQLDRSQITAYEPSGLSLLRVHFSRKIGEKAFLERTPPRIIEARWDIGGQEQVIESMDDRDLSSFNDDNPRIMRTLGLLEESVAAATEMIEIRRTARVGFDPGHP